MTVWVIRQTFSAEQEAGLPERADVELPFGDVSDLSLVHTVRDALELLNRLYPDEPPESIKTRLNRFWTKFSSLEMGDLVVVPLPVSNCFGLAEVTGHYHHAVGENGSDVHLIPVTWAKPPMPMSKLGKYKKIFENTATMFEIADAETRTAIRDQLPHSYNRFAKLKWLIIVFFLMNIIGMLRHFGG